MTFKYAKKGKQRTALPTNSTQDASACDPNIGATHVVTEVTYGFNAFLVFETRSIEGTSKEDIGGSLSIAIENLGPISAKGEGSFNMSEEVKDVTKSLKFTFHGDGVIRPPPQTYDEAIQVYKSLPDLSEKYERVVSFSIAPLSEYCGLAGKTCNLHELIIG